MSDITALSPAEAIELAADPGEFVVQCLERGKTWLTEALDHGDLDALVNMKGYAATLRVATMQKQLGKDAEIAATELVRRAERCIGLGIRRGQEVGTVRDWGHGVHTDYSIPSPAQAAGVTHNSQVSDLYDLADDVTDEQFEQAIEEAKAEKNLSRANVVRKVKGKPKPKATDRHEIHHKGRRIDAARIIEESIAMLDGIASGLALIEDVESLDAEKRLEWLNALSQPLAAINRFKKELSR